MAIAASAEPANAATQGRMVKWRIRFPLAMMTVCGSLRLPNTLLERFTGGDICGLAHGTHDQAITHY
jgi:hypothetical protein